MSVPFVDAERRGFRTPGTMFMVSGGFVGAIAAYIFQVYGGRALGPEEFAPIGVLWTTFFILTTVLLTPLEQYVTREVASGRKAIPHNLVPAAAMAVIGSVVGGGFVFVTLDGLFGGSWQYIVQMVLLMAGYSLLAVGKGVLAGGRRFRGFGWILIVESTARLVAGVVAILLFASAESLGWAMVFGGFAVLVTRWWRHDVKNDDASVSRPWRFLGGYVGASASSQLLLGGAPIAVATLSADPVLISIVFVTFTLFRAPLTLILLLQGRVLPYLVGLVGAGDSLVLTRIARRIMFAGAGLTVMGGLVGRLIGPKVVSVLFGEEFAPSATVAMFVAAGVMAAFATQIAGQLLVAEGRTSRLALGWLGGLIVGLVALAIFRGQPDARVAGSFAVGEVAALFLMSVLTTRR
jgi:O-antigen/teichoic acid export membrane protein